ncbi:hypothetical protein CGCS363_v010093 [Colletotrichum siamense]|uniref:uncharacterized protein n=1 Tax=Colletotrichum siamense TaxID=690259 RepID=UPI0018726E96|nr:uncharacterized protein CGCS363_v010093 [Colletotrichum siamense]KAF5494629.1 hypothetical protein CGCS363_v010093 [Colletotrichum siamense]
MASTFAVGLSWCAWFCCCPALPVGLLPCLARYGGTCLRAGTAPQRLRLQNIAVARTGTSRVLDVHTRSWWRMHVLQMCWAAVPPLPPC